MKLLSLPFFLILIPSIFIAQSLTIDPEFGFGGFNIHNYSSMDDESTAIVQDSEGSYLIACHSEIFGSGQVVISKFTSEGLLDLSFDDAGVSTYVFNNFDVYVSNILIQPDGKILVSGNVEIEDNNWDLFILRKNADGSNDSSFGSGGAVTFDIGPDDENIIGLDLDDSGNIYLSGEIDNASDNDDVLLMKFNSLGNIDTSFGEEGIVRLAIGNGDDQGRHLVLQEDGKIVVSGYLDTGDNDDLLLMRFNENGSPDSNFGNNGTVITTVGENDDKSWRVKIQGDGKILHAGTTEILDNEWQAVIVRYLPDGTLDTTFGNNGISSPYFGPGGESFNDFQILENGRIICIGYAENDSDFKLSIALLESDGSVNESIGYFETGIGFNDDSGEACLINSEGDLVITGITYNGNDWDYFIAKFNLNQEVKIEEEFENTSTTIQVFPNLIENENYISSHNITSHSVEISLMDLMGNRIKKIEKNELDPMGNNLIKVNLPNHISSGYYILEIEFNNKREHFLMLKQ